MRSMHVIFDHQMIMKSDHTNSYELVKRTKVHEGGGVK